jgi:DNA-directed RNA polymerase I, II, and III subunit RPABC1
MEDVYNVVKEMLNDRGIDVCNIPPYTEDLDSFYCSCLKVYFSEPKLGIKHMKEITNDLELEKINHAIIIFETSITPSAKQYLDEISKTFEIELFKHIELKFNVTKHSLVPKHELLDDKSKHTFCKAHKVMEKNLPRILVTDPIARYYNMKKGQFVKITRFSETAGTFVTYRVCV